jgi:hypothetical protein
LTTREQHSPSPRLRGEGGTRVSGRVRGDTGRRLQSFEEGRSADVSCACHWTVNVAASSGHGRLYADFYSVAPAGIFVGADSPIRGPADLAGVPISVGWQSGSHYSTIQALEAYLPADKINLSFAEGLLFRRLEMLVERRAPAVALFSGPYYFAEQLGFRKIIDTTFMIATMIHGDPDREDLRKFFRALRRAQRDLDLRPDRYTHYYKNEFPSASHPLMDPRRRAAGLRALYLGSPRRNLPLDRLPRHSLSRPSGSARRFGVFAGSQRNSRLTLSRVPPPNSGWLWDRRQRPPSRPIRSATSAFRRDINAPMDGGMGSAIARKRLAAFYTPDATALSLVRWAIRTGEESVLEPSVGGGALLKAAIIYARKLRPIGGINRPLACDIDHTAIEGLRNELGESVEFYAGDFLELDATACRKFEVAVANPPFTRNHSIDAARRKHLRKRYRIEGPAGIWVYFLAHSMEYPCPASTGSQTVLDSRLTLG